MGVSWSELQETPAYVVEDYKLVMIAELDNARKEAAKRKS